MKTIKLSSLLLIALLVFNSCDDEDPVILPVESKSVINLHAPQSADYTTNPPTITGDYIKFNFATGQTTTGDDWDIAFRGTTILVNGGEKKLTDEPSRSTIGAAYLTSGTFGSIDMVETSELSQDSSTEHAISGWYDYNPTNHLITPKAGKVVVVKTHDGHYAKMEIISYYKDKDTSSESRYFTFNYVYQPNDGSLSLE